MFFCCSFYFKRSIIVSTFYYMNKRYVYLSSTYFSLFLFVSKRLLEQFQIFPLAIYLLLVICTSISRFCLILLFKLLYFLSLSKFILLLILWFWLFGDFFLLFFRCFFIDDEDGLLRTRWWGLALLEEYLVDEGLFWAEID